MTDAEFDRRFTGMQAIEPTPLVVARTLFAWGAARRRDAWAVRAIALTGMIAMAAATVLVVDVPAPPAGHSSMVQRGSGDAAVRVDLATFVRQGQSVERFAVGNGYHAGDTLLFRVAVAEPMTLSLYRDDALIWSGRVPAGESQLPLGYTLEAGQRAAVFRVAGGTTYVSVAVAPVLP